MKSFLPLLVIATLPLTACESDVSDPLEASIAQGAGPVAIFHSVQRGNSAQAGSWSEMSGYSLEAWETSTGAGMWLSSYAVDPSSYHCEVVSFPPKDGELPEEFEQCWYTRTTYTWGGGQIAAADVESSGDRFFSVHTDLAASPDFFLESCTYDAATGEGDCASVTAAGRVDLEWNANNQQSYFNSGVSKSTFGNSSSRSNGTWRAKSADFSGTLLGAEAAGNGYIGRGMNVSRDLYRE